MSEIAHVLIDMDGVIADFFSAALSLWDYDPANYPAEEWEIASVLGIPESDFWGRINATENFWFNIKPYQWMPELIGILEARCGSGWTIATSPSMDPQCLSQKAAWLQKYIHPRFTRYMMGSR